MHSLTGSGTEHPMVLFRPSQTAEKQTLGVYRDAPHFVRQVRQVRQVRLKRHAVRNTHTPVAIKQALPSGTFPPKPNQTAASQTHGVSRGAPFLRTFPYVSVPIRFYCAAPCATRIPPQLSSCQAYPCGLSSPDPHPTAASKPTGYTETPLFCPTSQTSPT